ncbi:MAG: hypothetical protein VZR53_11675, partial [Prevotella sp.]|nr:hypothetical protein [Prevotella sp.]
VEWVKVRGNQYRAILRRDLLADNYDAIMESPCFIEKGYVGPEDSAIFNKEDMTFNQIKTRETILRDDSKTSWIVGYIAQDHVALSNKQFTLKPEVDMVISGNFSDWAYADWCDGLEHFSFDADRTNYRINFDAFRQHFGWVNKSIEFTKTTHSSYEPMSTQNDRWSVSDISKLEAFLNSSWWEIYNTATISTHLETEYPAYATNSEFQTLLTYMNKKIQFDDGVYSLSISYTSGLDSNYHFEDTTTDLYQYIYGVTNAALDYTISSTNRYPFMYKLYKTRFTVTVTRLENIHGTYTYNIPQTVRKLDDAPYKMFCIPYYKDVVTTNTEYGFSLNGTTRTDCNADLMLAWAMSIAKEFGDSLYDLQILPYCPLSNWRGRTGTTNAAIWSMDKTEHVDYEYLTETVEGTTYSRGVISFCDVSTKEQFLGQYSIEIMDYKIENQCDMYRLCSPNYASVFEFNAARNGGVEGYNVRYTYKPYQPFINVAPKFGRLYGSDFKDNRGLILSGDFSLPIVKDAWINYQLQNKNYQLAFDRQIENMEVNYGWQRAQGIANAVVGTVQGGTTGAMAGGMMGGATGAVIGGVIGTGASLAGGILDVNMQEALRNEAVDYARDNFGFQLGNIKALPNTLNKVSSIVANSKLFPFVEYYTCTDEEKKALDDKLKYNGMTIGRIGHILDFKHPDAQTYIKGQIIRLEGEFDTHTANEIANEFMKGWYI